MRRLLLLVAFVSLGLTIQAQDNVWETDLTKAINLSEKSKKPILMFFTGSDWCGWCVRLQKEVFNTSSFTEWANQNVILLELDFPRRTSITPELQKQNADLQSFFKVSGYPTIWITKATKTGKQISFEQLGSTGYVSGGPDVWIQGANRIISKK